MTAKSNATKTPITALIHIETDRYSNYTAGDLTIKFFDATNSRELRGIYGNEIKDLEITARLDKETRKWEWAKLTANLYHPDARDCEAAAKIMRSVEKHMQTLSEKYGDPANVGQVIMRMCDKLGVDSFTTPKDPSSDYHELRNIRSIEYWLDKQADKLAPLPVTQLQDA